MCAIFGILDFKPVNKITREDLEKSSELMSHRGPDDYGYYLNGSIGLGHRRLSIIDLATGRQPLYNEDRTIVTVCNGEIYNFKELRTDLGQRGHRFETHSDCEVIAHLYEEFGEDFVNHLRGMFAIALWDEKRKKLLLVRDRVGIKPLFYCLDEKRLIFASEISSIALHPSYEKRIDRESLHDYLSFMTTTGRKTMFDGIHRLLPAEMLTFTSDRTERRRLYWSPKQNVVAKKGSSEELKELLIDAVRNHLVSDVPVGAFLSGGLDSSTIVAIMSQVAKGPVKTFSVGFSGGQYYNELPYARRVAKCFGTEHHEIVVTPRAAEVIPKIIDHFGEPFAVSSALAMYYLSQFAGEKVKVVLTGDGADELMAGYTYRYLAVRLLPLFDRLSFLKKRWIASAFRFAFKSKAFKIQKFFSGMSAPPEQRYFCYLSKFQEEEKMRLYSEHSAQGARHYDSGERLLCYFRECDDGDLLNRWLYTDFKTSLPDEMLTKVDRMTMAWSLEARVPFLDHGLVEYLISLPSSYKFRRFAPKYLLRKAVRGMLPVEILRREKHGFEVPVDEWVRGELRDYVRAYLSKERIQREGIFNWNSVKEILDLHWEGRLNLGHQIWILLMFEVWHERFFG